MSANYDRPYSPYRLLLDGGAAISLSTLTATLLNIFGAIPHKIFETQDGVVLGASILLFPAAILTYGGTQMIFAGIHAYQERLARRERQREAALRQAQQESRAEGRKEGREEGRKEGRNVGREEGRRATTDFIVSEFERLGIEITPEMSQVIRSSRQE